MGFKRDYVDVELAPKDLLTVWGHEVFSWNLDRFFPKSAVKVFFPSKEEGARPFSNRPTLEKSSQNSAGGAWKADNASLLSRGGIPCGGEDGSGRFRAYEANPPPSGLGNLVFPTLKGGLEDAVDSCGMHVQKGSKATREAGYSGLESGRVVFRGEGL